MDEAAHRDLAGYQELRGRPLICDGGKLGLGYLGPGLERTEGAGRKEGGQVGGGQSELGVGALLPAQVKGAGRRDNFWPAALSRL